MNRREFLGMAALLPWLSALPAEVLAATPAHNSAF